MESSSIHSHIDTYVHIERYTCVDTQVYRETQVHSDTHMHTELCTFVEAFSVTVSYIETHARLHGKILRTHNYTASCSH